MAGISLNMGLGSSVFANGYPGAATPLAAAPSPQGNTSVGQKAFGIVTGGGGLYRTGLWASVGGGVLALAVLGFIYYSLPR